MKTLWAFINFKYDDWARFLLIAEFAHNNVNNASTSNMFFELNCDYHLQACYKEDVDPQSQSKIEEKLVTKLKELITVCKEDFQYA